MGDVRRSTRLAAIVVAIALSGACSGQGSPSDRTRSPVSQAPTSPSESTAATLEVVAQRIEEQLNAFEGVATGAIVLVRMGDQTRTFTSGMADVKHRRRMRPDDRFPVMSITKTMVATAVLQLVATRRLSLDDTVKDVVPGLLPQGHRITIRDLLSHRAGLYDPRDEDLPALSRMTDDSLIEVTADHPLEFRPGTSGSYSNVGYEVLGKVVEQVTGEPLGAAMEHNIFDPAGMVDTQLLGSPSVQGYYDSKAAPDPYVRFIPASAGVVSTVGDVDRFYTALSHGGLLDEDLVATMTTPLGTVEPFNVDYGLGVWFDRESCGVAWGHSGAGPGFATKAWTLPDADRSVVVMVNDGDGQTIADGFATAALCD